MNRIFLILLMCLSAIGANAQYANIKGSATVKYQTVLTPDDKERAIEAASMNAIERYFSERGEAQNQVYDTNEDNIRKNLAKLIQNTAILSDQNTPDLRRYQMTVRVELNEARLKNIIKSTTAATTASGGEKSNFTFLFTARVANSVKSFDTRVVKIAQSSGQAEANSSVKTTGSEGEKITRSQVSTNASKSVSAKSDAATSVKVETGGSSTNKADEIGYQILSMTPHKSSVISIFTQSGFSIKDSAFVLSDTDASNVNKDYSSGNDISPSTMRSVLKTLKTSGNIKYFVLAVTDVSLGRDDPISGMKLAGVQVSARVISVDGTDVASIPAVQISSLGRTDEDARTSALKKATEQVSREIIAQLNNLGIK